jgi:hypothetical protein
VPNLSPHQFPQITADEARGDSQAVTPEHFQQIAQKGHDYLAGTARKTSTAGLDADWEGVKEHAWQKTRESWGGVTINSHTGEDPSSGKDLGAAEAKRQGVGHGLDRYAVTARQPGQEQISVPENVSRHQFGGAMDKARESYPQLGNRGHHLGVFHDDEKGTIDIDPVVVVRTRDMADAVGAASHSVGGAYHFASGNGAFAPHVKGSGTDGK